MAYVMDKVDFVLVGSEAVVESGGLVNAVGSNQIAIIARAANKPFYALAERYLRPSLLSMDRGLTSFSSYKFHRLFPLSQYDLPSHNSQILSFPPSLPANHLTPGNGPLTPPDISEYADSTSSRVTQEQISQNNPHVDYTRSTIFLTSANVILKEFVDPISFP